MSKDGYTPRPADVKLAGDAAVAVYPFRMPRE
jgi:hypothetical protein